MLEIVPRKGLGNVRFGMTQEEVQSLLGKEEDQSITSEASEFYYANYINCAFRYQSLYQIGATRRSSGILYNGNDIFTSNSFEVLKEMQVDGGSVFEYFGFIIFLELGISLTGFHDGDLDQKAMTVFEEGTWSDLQNEFKVIDFRRL